MTNYNDGKWHGWNGGECPVHPKSVVEVRGLSETVWKTEDPELAVYWPKVIVFRVIAPYIEPQEYSGECYAYYVKSMAPSLVENELSGTIKGRWTATHINGKLAKITWEAAE